MSSQRPLRWLNPRSDGQQPEDQDPPPPDPETRPGDITRPQPRREETDRR